MDPYLPPTPHLELIFSSFTIRELYFPLAPLPTCRKSLYGPNINGNSNSNSNRRRRRSNRSISIRNNNNSSSSNSSSNGSSGSGTGGVVTVV